MSVQGGWVGGIKVRAYGPMDLENLVEDLLGVADAPAAILCSEGQGPAGILMYSLQVLPCGVHAATSSVPPPRTRCPSSPGGGGGEAGRQADALMYSLQLSQFFTPQLRPLSPTPPYHHPHNPTRHPALPTHSCPPPPPCPCPFPGEAMLWDHGVS